MKEPSAMGFMKGELYEGAWQKRSRFDKPHCENSHHKGGGRNAFRGCRGIRKGICNNYVKRIWLQTGFFSCIIKIADFTDNRKFSCEYIWAIRGGRQCRRMESEKYGKFT